ncbi:hypothetical protein [Natranaerobius trueperi]|uniref:YgiT-type zinc finger domain-containing protein n=1 Tax=Natranaerobius trueperi TaxID=759412 RepID=A0A226BXA4_9FIRM|nr:hypothetical protein [Natranaerobius trueperi]OWZ82737.1 hypothetical protein CDO51_12470 [Natranaerobius trueperi]
MSKKLEELKEILDKDYSCDKPELYPSRCSSCKSEDLKLGKSEWQFSYGVVTGIPGVICIKCGQSFLHSDLLVEIEDVLEELGYNDPNIKLDLSDLTEK